jgi:hypothetical protein
MKAKKLNWRQAQCSLLLACFDFIMHHQPGKSMGKSDALSCRANHGSSTNDYEDIVLLTLDLFAIRALKGLQLVREEKEILKEMENGETEEAVARAAKELQKISAYFVQSSEWSQSLWQIKNIGVSLL